jgi:flagella basal body P-ring formation protein FlgA
VRVSVAGSYLVSSRKINRGQTITDLDLEARHGDLTELPATVLTSPRLVIGQRARVSLAAHQPLRREHLFLAPVIRQGDKVRVVSRGTGFAVATEGVALNNAAEGETIKVRASSGRTLTGIARSQGEVELLP